MTIKLSACLLVSALALSAAEPEPQFQQRPQQFNNNNQNFRPAQQQNFNNQNFQPNNFQQQQLPQQTSSNTNVAQAPQSSFRATPADRRDRSGLEIYPGCNGTVCLPEANRCAIRKQKVGHFQFGGSNYWFSWSSDEHDLRNARWNWFTGRNYCRKMCMDLVSFETAAEQQFVSEVMSAAGVSDIHTSGRLCDKEVEGCEQARFQPLSVNGWFWASTLRMMPPTNRVSDGQIFNNWATTGTRNSPQPDGAIRADGFGNEACVALINNANFGGLKWHDEVCNTRRLIVCEDLPQPNINFVRNQNPGISIP